MKTIKYYANGINYKFVKEDDSWISVYKWNTNSFKWQPLIQAKNIEKAEEYADLREELNFVPTKL